MNASAMKNRAPLRVSLTAVLAFLLSELASGATNARDINDVSPEERAALKNKPCSNVMEECFQRHLPPERTARLLIVKLKDESIRETLSKLEEPGFQGDVRVLIYEGRPWVYRTGIPLPKDSDYCAGDLLTVLNNPRFVKLVLELPAMSRAEMAAMINADLDASLVRYDKSYQSLVPPALGNYDSTRNDPTGRLLPMSFETIGLRYRVLVLLTLAGRLQLQECQPTVQRIVDYAIRQRDQLYDRTKYEYDFASGVLDQGTLYHRQILATALLQTSLTPKEAEQVLADIGAKYRERKVKPYDQMLSLVHLPHLAKGEKVKRLRVLDDENGTIGIKVVEELDDSQFNRLVEAVKNASQQGGLPAGSRSGDAARGGQK